MQRRNFNQAGVSAFNALILTTSLVNKPLPWHWTIWRVSVTQMLPVN